jgi:Ca2+-binding RTX toxin-like protein
MTVHRIKTDPPSFYMIDHSNDTWIFEPGVTVSAIASSAIQVGNAYHDSIIQLLGTAFGAVKGIDAAGAATSIVIEKSGYAFGGDAGIAMTGTGSSLANHGDIESPNGVGISFSGISAAMSNDGYVKGGTDAVLAENSKYTITNDGTLTAKNGITLNNADVKLTLGEHSFVVATDMVGIAVTSSAANTTTVINHGVVRAIQYSYSGGDGEDHLTNTGFLGRAVQLGGGDDVADLRGGFVDGTVTGGLGDDVFIISSSKVHLSEDADGGTDTVRSTVSYALEAEFEKLVFIGTGSVNGTGNAGHNILTGNKAANHLDGMAGNDNLNGGGGNDTLTGGDDADTFAFSGKFGKDVIEDFTAGMDHINLSKFGDISGYKDLVAHHMTATANTVRITHGGDVITLEHIHKSDLHAGDFIF